MSSQQQLLPHIHHEKQEKGSMLCAQHALNALLQGNYYDATQLADIARELDGLEASQLGLSTEAIASRDRNSLNMDDTGFFSVSVLERALQIWGLSLVNWRSAQMRPRQPVPENERAFVLNLNSHWFTIRSFGSSGHFWYNLNSFLAEPSWIGKNYLGTLLQTAETEGYSVFVVYASEGTVNDSLLSSDADQIADLLPPPGSSGGASSSHASLGLKPQKGSTSASASSFATARSNEDADLQAALRMSLAESERVSSPASLGGKEGLRRARSGSGSNSIDGVDLPETDADIDAIAPTRRRLRAGFGSGSGGAAGVGQRSNGTTSGVQDEEEDLRRAMEASLTASSSAATASASASASASTSASTPYSRSASAMALDSPSPRHLNRRRRRIQRPEAEGTSHASAIDLDALDDTALSASLPSRSPFLSPAMVAANANNDDVDDLVSDDDDDDEALDPFDVPGAPEASAVIGRQDRHYDDEDRELQAALAASLGDEEAAARFGRAGGGQAQGHGQGQGYGYGYGEGESTPADVDRIRRMREEGRRKEVEEREREERRRRGEVVEGLGGKAGGQGRKSRGKDEDEDEDEDEEEEEAEAEEISPEEMRRRRLARFG